MSRNFDAENEILASTAITATGNQTAATVEGLIGDAGYVGVIYITSNAGTVDGSNYFTLGFEVSSDGTNYYSVGNSIDTYDAVATAENSGNFEVGFTGNQLVEAAGGTPTHMRIVATKTGTTQTGVTTGAYIAKV